MDDNYMLVFSSAVGGRDEEFNLWYDEVHIPEVCARGGLTLARRYVAGPGALGRPAPPHKYLALYDMGEDPAARFRALEEMLRADPVTPSETNDPSSIYVWQYHALKPAYHHRAGSDSTA